MSKLLNYLILLGISSRDNILYFLKEVLQGVRLSLWIIIAIAVFFGAKRATESVKGYTALGNSLAAQLAENEYNRKAITQLTFEQEKLIMLVNDLLMDKHNKEWEKTKKEMQSLIETMRRNK